MKMDFVDYRQLIGIILRIYSQRLHKKKLWSLEFDEVSKNLPGNLVAWQYTYFAGEHFEAFLTDALNPTES